MKLYSPLYYKEFKCKAEKCSHNCCVGWEIDLDSDAISRYELLEDGGREILDTVDFSAEPPHFRLGAGERCPHLDGRGLCRIISKHGEGYLCDICREHPRFYNYPMNRCEVGIGAACEEAARLILKCGDYSFMCELGEGEHSPDGEISFDAVFERERIYGILSDSSLPYGERLSRIYTEYAISPASLRDSEWRAVIAELEYIDEKSRTLFLSYSQSAIPENAVYAERALAYFIYRHTGSALTSSDFLLSLGLALFLERLFVSAVKESGSEAEVLRILSEEIEYSEDNLERIKTEFL